MRGALKPTVTRSGKVGITGEARPLAANSKQRAAVVTGIDPPQALQ
jgi:hypothetical protein